MSIHLPWPTPYLGDGPVEEVEVNAIKAKVEYLLMRVKWHLLEVPAGIDIITFLQFDGKPPDHHRPSVPKEVSFSEFTDSYLKIFSNGAIEANALYNAKIHLGHLAKTLVEQFAINSPTCNATSTAAWARTTWPALR